jgi:hypothetical protein
LVNVQAELFPNGSVNICWGSGNTAGNSIAAGLEDKGLGLYFPAVGDTFSGSNGITNAWPTDYCICFGIRDI